MASPLCLAVAAAVCQDVLIVAFLDSFGLKINAVIIESQKHKFFANILHFYLNWQYLPKKNDDLLNILAKINHNLQ